MYGIVSTTGVIQLMMVYLLQSDNILIRSAFSSALAHLRRCRDTICSNFSRPLATFCHGRSIIELLITWTPARNDTETLQLHCIYKIKLSANQLTKG